MSRSRTTSGGELPVEVCNRGNWCVVKDSCKGEFLGLPVESSTPTATRRPPEESEILVAIGEADNGSGFRLTGEGLLTLDVCAWNAGKDGTSLAEAADGFTRPDGAIVFVEMSNLSG